MVQRYILQGGLIGPHDEGDWVGYEDYKDLDDDFQDYITTTDMEIEGLVARLAEVNAELQKYKDQFPDYVAAADVLAEIERIDRAAVTKSEHSDIQASP